MITITNFEEWNIILLCPLSDSIYKKAIKKNTDKVQMVVGKKQYGNRRPPGVKGRYKVVDSRMKKDKRNETQSQKGRGKASGKKAKQSKGAKKSKGKGRKQ